MFLRLVVILSVKHEKVCWDGIKTNKFRKLCKINTMRKNN
jgi:hypothetical protein